VCNLSGELKSVFCEGSAANNGGREGLAFRGASCVLKEPSTQETPLRQAPHR